MAFRSSVALEAWRIADKRYKIFDGTGAMVHGGRWNSPGRRVIYAAETYSGALLEVLVHTSGRVPAAQVYVRIDIPTEVGIEFVTPDDVSGWDDTSFTASRQYGDRWYDTRRTAVLVVPSAVTHVDRNVLINEEHPDFGRIHATEPAPVHWDERLWRRPQ